MCFYLVLSIGISLSNSKYSKCLLAIRILCAQKLTTKLFIPGQSLEDSNYPFNPLKKYLVLKIDKAVEQIDIRYDNTVYFASGYKLIRANFFYYCVTRSKKFHLVRFTKK